MDKLKKYRENIYTILLLIGIPFAIGDLWSLILYINKFLGVTAFGFITLIISAILFAVLLYPVLLSIGVALVFLAVNIIRYFSLKKKMIQDNTFDKSIYDKKYLFHKIFFLVSMLSFLFILLLRH